MADRLTDFVHKCMKHGGVEGSVSFAKPNGYSVLASTDTLKDGATAIFVSDQTELPLDDDKDKGKEAHGQLSLLKGSGN